MKLKDIIWETCSKCGCRTKIIQEESYGCDECKTPIDDLLHPKQNEYSEHIDLTVFWKNGEKEAASFQYCSYKCMVKALKKFIKNRACDFISLPICSFSRKIKGQTPKDLINLFK